MAANRWLGSSKHGNGEAEFLCCFVLGVEVQGNKRLCLPFVAVAPAWIDNIASWVGQDCMVSAFLAGATFTVAEAPFRGEGTCSVNENMHHEHDNRVTETTSYILCMRLHGVDCR